jgi:hypothetical protein
MLKQPTKKTRKPGGCSELRQRLATLDKPELLELVKDLYEATAYNRDFIQARSQVGEASTCLTSMVGRVFAPVTLA